MTGNFLKKHRMLRSFRLRIFLVLMLVGLIISFAMYYGMFYDYVDRTLSEKTMEMTEQLRITANRLVNYDYIVDHSSDVIREELSMLSIMYDGRVLVIDQGFRVIDDTYDISVGKIMIGEEVLRCYKGQTITNYDKNSPYIEVAVPVTKLDMQSGESVVEGVLLVSASTDIIRRTETEIRRRAKIYVLLILIMLFGVSFGISSAAVRPFDRVVRSISGAVTFDDEPEMVMDYRETEDIVNAFLKQRQRLKTLDESRQEFVSNVSHELKTPIASIKVLADSLNMQDDVPVEIYREFMQDITTEIDRENDIITDLLELVRMEKGAGALHIENVSINELLEQIVKRLAPLARKSEVDLILESRRSVSADIDTVKITQAVTNIIENGIKYNKHPGWVKILLDADHQNLTLEITDSGVGIPEAELDHIFERFYRGDKSHSKEISGTGLGLAITRRTILLHRGTIEADSVVGEGSSFLIKLPVSYKLEQRTEG